MDATLAASLGALDADAMEARDLSDPAATVLWCAAAGIISVQEAAHAWNQPRRVRAMVALTQVCQKRLAAHLTKVWEDWGGIKGGSGKCLYIERWYDHWLVMIRWEEGRVFRVPVLEAPLPLRDAVDSVANFLSRAACVGTGTDFLNGGFAYDDVTEEFKKLESRAAVEAAVAAGEDEGEEIPLRYLSNAGEAYDAWAALKGIEKLKQVKPGSKAMRLALARCSKRSRWRHLIEGAERLNAVFSRSGQPPYFEEGFDDEGATDIYRGAFLSLVDKDRALFDENLAMMEGTNEWPTEVYKSDEADAPALLRHFERQTAAEALLSRWA